MCPRSSSSHRIDFKQWSDPTVYIPLIFSFLFCISFLLVEFFVAVEPVLAPSLLKQRIPILVATSNFLVATCNFSITYFFHTWFQTVGLTSASIAGEVWCCGRAKSWMLMRWQAYICYRTACRCHWGLYSLGALPSCASWLFLALTAWTKDG